MINSFEQQLIALLGRLVGAFERVCNDRDREAGGDVPADGHDGPDLHAESQGGAVTERIPFWTGPGYRGEYNCPHGVGHGNYVHGCCEEHCCSRNDFPLGPKFRQRTTIDRPCPKCGRLMSDVGPEITGRGECDEQ